MYPPGVEPLLARLSQGWGLEKAAPGEIPNIPAFGGIYGCRFKSGCFLPAENNIGKWSQESVGGAQWEVW